MDEKKVLFLNNEEKLALIMAEVLDIDPLPHMNYESGSLGENFFADPTPAGDVQCETAETFNDAQKQKLKDAGLAVEYTTTRVGEDNIKIRNTTISCNGDEIDSLLEGVWPLKSENAKEFAMELMRVTRDVANGITARFTDGSVLKYSDIADNIKNDLRELSANGDIMYGRILDYLILHADGGYRVRNMSDGFIRTHNDNIRHTPFTSPFMIGGAEIDSPLPDLTASEKDVVVKKRPEEKPDNLVVAIENKRVERGEREL